MAVNKVPRAEAQVETNDGRRTQTSDVVPSNLAAPIESISERDAGSDDAGGAAGTLRARARTLRLGPPARFIVPARAPVRIARGFSLPARLMQSARKACDIVARNAQGRWRVRVWVPSCKTGGTAYTIGMLLLEATPLQKPVEPMVFATDVNERALALAREGRYPVGAAFGMDPGLRARHTFDEGQTLRVAERLRERCLFSRHDLGHDPPFPRLDLIVCEQIFQGVAPSKRPELVRRLFLGLRHDGLLLAFDHPECFAVDFFEPAGDGCFRPRKERRPLRPYLSLREPSLHESIAVRQERLEETRPAFVPRGSVSKAHADASDVIRTLGHPLVLCDARLRVVVMSVEARRLFDGFDAGQPLELATLAECLSGGLAVVSAARRVVAEHVDQHEDQDVVVRQRGRTYLASVRPAFDGQGVSVAFTDVTTFEATAAWPAEPQPRRQPSRREDDLELEALYASLPVAVSLHDRTGALLRANRALAPLTAGGTVASDTDGAEERERTLLRRLYADEMPRWIERTLATGEPLHDVELRVTEGDERRSWRCNFVPLRGAAGGVQGVSTVAWDITALKRLEALSDADKRKDDFIALLAHELRNPIAAIRNATELLGRLEHPTPQLYRLQGIYERQTLHTAKLLDDLLDVARVARGKIRLQRFPLSVSELVRAAVDDRRAQFQARRLELRLPDGELWVLADRVRLLQIVDNLLSNALKFTSGSGKISVAVERARGQGAIVITDDGAGIAPDVLPFIFEPFWQARSSAETTGLGIGLALIHGLTQLHGFRMTAESAGLGCGASFRLTFPLVEAPEASVPPSQVAHHALDLMLVEDNGDVAETLAELLEADGHRVEVASSAERALERLRARRVDVVLIDIGLPGMNGLELAARLRRDPELSRMRLVALTGFGDAATEGRMLDGGFDRYLLKPVRFETLRHCLARVRVARTDGEPPSRPQGAAPDPTCAPASRRTG